MDIKFLIGILNRPWMMEPAQAEHWMGIANDFIAGRIAGVPTADTRRRFNDFFKVDAKGNITDSGNVQVLGINGPIGKYDYCGTPGSQSLQQAIGAANADSTIESIVLLIDSPGGQVDGTENLASAVKGSKKPVVAFVDGMMASAAYWIGSSASEIVVDKANNGFNAMIGSIGTMAMWQDSSKKNEMSGIKVHTVYADKSRDKNGIMQKANAGDYTDIKSELNNLNDTFLSAVQSNRQGKIDIAKEDVLTGKVYDGKESIKFGLADRMGDFQTAVKRSLQIAKQQKLFNSNTNNMNAFQKTLSAAKATQFAVVDGGFLLEEDGLNNIEAALDAAVTTESQLSANVTSLTGELATANESRTAAEASLATANQTIATQAARILVLEKGPAQVITNTTKPGADQLPGEAAKVIDPVTQEANKLRAMMGKPALA